MVFNRLTKIDSGGRGATKEDRGGGGGGGLCEKNESHFIWNDPPLILYLHAISFK